MKISLSNDDILPFSAYRKVKLGGEGFERGLPEEYSSIEHFYQSEKFRGSDESYRQYIISLPTAREARKAARKRLEDVRPDWDLIRNRVMMAAICFKLISHDRYAQALLANPDLANNAYRFQDHYWGDLRDGVSIGFYRRLLNSYLEKRRTGIMRVLVTGSTTFKNEELFNTKLRSLFRKSFPDELIINCEKGSDALAEKWSINNNIPVRHYPLRAGHSKSERLNRINEVLGVATHVIVFWQGASPRIAEFVTAAKKRAIPIRIFKISPDGQLITPASTARGRNLPARTRP